MPAQITITLSKNCHFFKSLKCGMKTKSKKKQYNLLLPLIEVLKQSETSDETKQSTFDLLLELCGGSSLNLLHILCREIPLDTIFNGDFGEYQKEYEFAPSNIGGSWFFTAITNDLLKNREEVIKEVFSSPPNSDDKGIQIVARMKQIINYLSMFEVLFDLNEVGDLITEDFFETFGLSNDDLMIIGSTDLDISNRQCNISNKIRKEMAKMIFLYSKIFSHRKNTNYDSFLIFKFIQKLILTVIKS